MVNYKIRKNYNRKGPQGERNKFYLNVADFHLPRPRLKIKNGVVDGFPIVHVDTGRGD